MATRETLTGQAQHPLGQSSLSQHLLRSRPIAVHRNLLSIAGAPCSGILLSQLTYWTRRGTEVVQREGWVFKTAEQWEHETGMSWKVQRRARRILVDLGLLEERNVGIPRRLEFRLNLPELSKRLADYIKVEIDQSKVNLDLFRSEDLAIKTLLGHVIKYHRILAQITPHINDALLLSRLLHDERQMTRWQVRGRADWLKELSMSRDEWETARKHLRVLGLLLEKQGNYPRRVYMMVNHEGLTGRLSEYANGAQESGRDRAMPPRKSAQLTETKALGGIGRFSAADYRTPVSPNPAQPIPAGKNRVSASPDPAYPKAAYSDSPSNGAPIPPQVITQSHPYVLKGLQVPLHPHHTGGAGVGFERNDEESGQQAAHMLRASLADVPSAGVARPGPPLQNHPIPPTVATPDLLVWPGFMEEALRPGCWWHLSALPLDVAQTILDEVDWCHSRKGVPNPTGLVRTLADKARLGTFAPEGAALIAKKRRAPVAVPTPGPVDKALPSEQATVAPEEVILHKAQIRQRMEVLRQRMKLGGAH